ncbi:hypothetical protein EMO89_05555 [Bifidobacterium tissieri]|uniref:Uncharacterized protein n=2 Tax=Bifidobacterium TaxID=1678 RepID=A0A5M9ZSE3_9BIFI|nr:hypothetical protein [Bifidobacterium tissieri]KAA8830450.1 hypothetical protein EMO89_05555 [Bifidobacterium tissieri]
MKNISIDVLPRKILNESNDWTGIYVSRSMVLPLFRESEDGYLPGLAETTEKLGNDTWKVSLNAEMMNSANVDAGTILHSWMQLATAKTGMSSLLKVLQRVKVDGKRSLILHTSMQINDMQSYLAHPLLGIIPEKQNVNYGSNSMTAQGSSGSKITFQYYKDFNAALRSYSKGNLDSITGIGIPSQTWKKLCENGKNRIFNTNLNIAIKIPPKYSSLKNELMGLRYDALEDLTHNQLESMSYHNPPHKDGCDDELWLTYPDYPPNQEVCTWLASQMLNDYGIRIHCQKISYDDYLMGSIRSDNVLQFLIEADPWASAESMNLIFNNYCDHMNTSDDASLETASSTHLNLARVNKEGILRIGKMRGLKITRLSHVSIPHSGWIGWDDDLFY